jgi:hypothetical protein
MAKRTKKTKKKAKALPEARVTLVVDTLDDDALDLIVETIEDAIESLDGEVKLDLTLAASLDAADEEEEDDVDDDDDVDEDEEEEDDDEEEEDDDEEEEEEEDDDYLSLDDLKKMKVPELKKLAKEYGIKSRTSWKKEDYIKAIVEIAGEED